VGDNKTSIAFTRIRYTNTLTKELKIMPSKSDIEYQIKELKMDYMNFFKFISLKPLYRIKNVLYRVVFVFSSFLMISSCSVHITILSYK